MRVVLAAVALLMFVSPAFAGTMEDPEITDAADDHQVTGGLPDPEGVVKSVDLIAGWVVGLDGGMLELRLQASQEMRGGNVEGEPTTQYEYAFHFEAAGEEHVASAEVVGNPPVVTPGGVATEAYRDEVETSVLVLRVPAENVSVAPGDPLTSLYATSRVFFEGDIATDRAPDSEFGRDAELAPGEANVTVIPLTGDGITGGLEAEAPNGTYVWTWNATQGDHDLALSVAGGACDPCFTNITVTAGNETIHTCDACDDVEINRVVSAGNVTWNITATKHGEGSFSFSITPHEEPESTNTTSAPPPNTTTSPTEEDEDSPAVWLPVLVVPALAAWRRR